MVILKSAMRQSFHRLEKPQISDSMRENMRIQKEKEQPMNQAAYGPRLMKATVTNKDIKTIPTGDLFIITLDEWGTEDLPLDWSTFKQVIYDQVNVGESWEVWVSTKPKDGQPNEFYRNIHQFVEMDVEASAEYEAAHSKPVPRDIPQENEAIGVPYPPDDPTWWETRLMQGLTAKDININIAVALKAVADVIVAKSATPQLYDPANAFNDLIAETRRVCREVYMMPYAEQGEE